MAASNGFWVGDVVKYEVVGKGVKGQFTFSKNGYQLAQKVIPK